MPGLLSHHLRDADALHFCPIQFPLPSRNPSNRSTDFRRMPLHHLTTVRYDVNETTVDLPEEPRINQHINHLLINHNNQVHNKDNYHFASDFPSDLHGSAESEHDLAAMVHDFMENGSYGSDFPESSDGENGITNGPKLFETLQALKSNSTPAERELLSTLTMLSLSIKEIDLICNKKGAECNGGCIRRLFVKHLRLSGCDAAICSSKWSNSGKLPGGEYEYIDVCLDSEKITSSINQDRLIVDVDFLSQFEIARPTHSYAAALKLLPVIFVGSAEKLKQTLQVMAEATKLSLKQNLMPLPPWRTLEYMTAKWMSPYERSANDLYIQGKTTTPWRDQVRAKQCIQQLRHLKQCIATESEKNHVVGKANSLDSNNRVVYFPKAWRSNRGSKYLL